MDLKVILNAVAPIPGFVYGKQRWETRAGRRCVIVDVRPHEGRDPRCSGCSRPGRPRDRLPPRRFEFVPLWGMAVFLVYAMRRVRCDSCGVKVEAVPWAQGKSRITLAFQWFLAAWAKRLSWKETARAFGTSWNTVYRAVAMAVLFGRLNLEVDRVGAIGVDELSYGRGQKYLTLVYQLDAGRRRLLWIGKGRTAQTLRSFFAWLGPEVTRRLEFVCSDLWRPYLDVVRALAGQAVHVLDPFHIAQHLSKAIDVVRRADVHRLRSEGKKPILKDSRWCLLRRPKNRTPQDRIKLRDLLRCNLRTVRCTLLRWEFDHFWTYAHPTRAARFLDDWCRSVMTSRLEPLKKVARMLRRHRSYLIDFIRVKGLVPTGAVEGFNNKARVITRRAYGFRSPDVMQVALYHTLGHLPEPAYHHEFW